MAQEVKKGIDFSVQLPQGSDPVSPNGNLLVQAAATEGQAAVVGAQATDVLAKQVAGTAIDAAHGYMEAGVEASVRETTDYLKKSNLAASGIDILGSPASTPADKAKAEADIMSVKNALTQGIMSRDQAILQIDKKVKEYSNILPGYASSLRAFATKITGVEHMGAYAEYSLLNKQSMSEKLLADRMKFAQEAQQKLTLGFISEYNRLPNGESDLQMYAALGAAQAAAKKSKADSESLNLGLAEREKAVIDGVQQELAGGMLQLSLQISGLFGAKDPQGKPIPPENMAIVKGKIVSDITKFYDGLEAGLLRVPSASISAETKQKQLADLRTQRDNMVKGLSNQDNFDVFTAQMKISKLGAEEVTNDWIRRNAGLEIMRRSGVVLPETMQMYFQGKQTPAAEARFAAKYPAFYQYMETILGSGKGSGGGGGSNPAAVLGDNLAEVGRNPQHLEAMKVVNPVMHTTAVMTVASTLEDIGRSGFGKDPQTQETRKVNAANWLEAFSIAADGRDPSLTRKWFDVVSGGNGNFLGKMSELSKADSAKAFNIILQKTRSVLEAPETGLFEVLKREISEQANQYWQPSEIKLSLNPTTKQFQFKIKQSVGGWITSDGRGLAAGALKDTLSKINKGMSILTNLEDLKQLPGELSGKDISQVFLNRYNSDFFSLPFSQRKDAIERATKVEQPVEKPLKLDKPIPTSELIQ